MSPRAEHDPVIAAAEARAAADVAKGIESLKDQYAKSHVWKEAWHQDGRRRAPDPERAMLAGHLRRLGIDPASIPLKNP